MTQRLFESVRTRWKGSREIQYLLCPWCETSLDQLVSWTEVPLFSHAGYGEATRHDTRTCQCGLTLVGSTLAVSPRPYR